MKELRVDFIDKESKYITLYRKIKESISCGDIQKGEKLPSKRELASSLGVSLNTIMNAYNLLLEEEYIYAVEKSGYFVSSSKHYKQNKRKINDQINWKKEYRFDFSSESVASSLFPSFTFRKVTSDVLLNNPTIWLDKTSPLGEENLRATIADYLYRNKGMNVNYENVLIVSSLENSLQIISSLIKIDKVGIEEYCYQKVRNFFKERGKKVIDFPLDEEGVYVNEDVDLLYTTPYNQFPLGIVMSKRRKNELLSKTNTYILEDDYDCDLLLSKKIISTLFSLDEEKVFYHGSFSHSICSGLRISYLVVPSKFIPLVNKRFASSSSISSLDQAILNEFIKGGHYFRHLNKLKKSLAGNKELIRKCLVTNPYIKVKINPLSFIISFDEKVNINVLKEYLKREKIKIRFLSSFCQKEEENRMLLCYSSINKDDIESAITLLNDIIIEAVNK
ncbi:MAG: PLP-dependent aminotransferase family protein [Bacilli bacterium]